MISSSPHLNPSRPPYIPAGTWVRPRHRVPCTILVIGSDVVGNAVLLSRIHHMIRHTTPITLRRLSSQAPRTKEQEPFGIGPSAV
jgi:hypothetical protein